MFRILLFLSIACVSLHSHAQTQLWQFYGTPNNSTVSLMSPIAWENGVLRAPTQGGQIFIGRAAIGAAQSSSSALPPSTRPQLLRLDGRWYALNGSVGQSFNAPLHTLGEGSYSNCRTNAGPLEPDPAPPRIDLGLVPAMPIPLASTCNGFNDNACIAIRYQENADVLVVNSRNGGVICDGEVAAPTPETIMQARFEDNDIAPGFVVPDNTIAMNPLTGAAIVKTSASQVGVFLNLPNTVVPSQSLSVNWLAFGFAGPVACTANSSPTASGWSGLVSTSPSAVTLPAGANFATLGLSCAGVSAAGATLVMIASASVTPCGPQGYLGTPYNVSVQPFQSAFQAPFPANNEQLTGALGNQQALALEFVAPASVPADGFFNMAQTAGGGSGVSIASISRCAGTFGDYLNVGSRICSGASGEPQIEWTINNQLPFSGFRCLLVPGTRYFLNLAVSDCSGSSACAFRVFSRTASQ